MIVNHLQSVNLLTVDRENIITHITKGHNLKDPLMNISHLLIIN